MNEIAVVLLILVLTILLRWSFKTLPGERWQFLATIPLKKLPEGGFAGLNITYYGVFNAMAMISAAVMMLLLLGACGIPAMAVMGVVLVLLAVCIPAASLTASVIEKKKHTFSVGGAAFVGLVLAPFIIWFLRILAPIAGMEKLQPLAVLSAVGIAYALGEGVGRLACISFGCCYGKPIDQLPGVFQRIFRPLAMVFQGATRKAVYAHNLSGVPLLPIQGITAVLNCMAAVVGMYLFLRGWVATAFLVTIVTTMGWRFCSEFLRADFRGKGSISVYQWMSLVSIPYAILVSFFFPVPGAFAPQILEGVTAVWNPSVLIILQVVGLGVLWHFGKSRVTGSTVSFHVIRENI